jgi:uncharacterized membrane protein YqaE (UPF0057 family)
MGTYRTGTKRTATYRHCTTVWPKYRDKGASSMSCCYPPLAAFMKTTCRPSYKVNINIFTLGYFRNNVHAVNYSCQTVLRPQLNNCVDTMFTKYTVSTWALHYVYRKLHAHLHTNTLYNTPCCRITHKLFVYSAVHTQQIHKYDLWTCTYIQYLTSTLKYVLYYISFMYFFT